MIGVRAFLAAWAAIALCGCSIFIPSHHDPLAYKEIHAAAEGGDLAKVANLYRREHGVINAREWDNITPVHLAVLHRHAAVAEFLLAKGADPNAKTSRGITPLHFAAQVGDIQSAKLLLDHGAQINAVDGNGWTPLDRAVKWRQTQMANFLRSRRAQTPPQSDDTRRERTTMRGLAMMPQDDS